MPSIHHHPSFSSTIKRLNIPKTDGIENRNSLMVHMIWFNALHTGYATNYICYFHYFIPLSWLLLNLWSKRNNRSKNGNNISLNRNIHLFILKLYSKRKVQLKHGWFGGGYIMKDNHTIGIVCKHQVDRIYSVG